MTAAEKLKILNFNKFFEIFRQYLIFEICLRKMDFGGKKNAEIFEIWIHFH